MLRLINVAFGAWLVVAPWLLQGASTPGVVVSIVLGLMLMALSLPRGRRSVEHYAGWDRYIV